MHSRRLIQRLDDIFPLLSGGSRALCLYSGGLDGSYLLTALAGQARDQVLALSVDLGGEPVAETGVEVCRQLGVELVVVDRIEEFVRTFVAPAIFAHAVYLGTHPICASLSRPAIAATACEIAHERGCDIILHTSDSSQNSMRRFNGALSRLGFEGYFGSPFATGRVSRDEKRRTLAEAGVAGFGTRMNSFDSNIWGREFEAGNLDDPERVDVPETLYGPSSLCDDPQEMKLAIEFREGLPVTLNEQPMELNDIIRALNKAGSAFRLGRYIALEEIESGAKVQEMREMPAAQILFEAYRRIESACVPAEVIREKLHAEQLWVREAVEGRWFGLMREATQAFMRTIASRVSGSVEYRLTPNVLALGSLRAVKPLYVRNRNDVR